MKRHTDEKLLIKQLNSQLKQLQQKYEDTDFLLRTIIDYSPGMIYWKDQNSRYLGVNKYWCEITGIDKVEDVLGKKDKDIWPDEDDSLRKNDLKVLKTGKSLVAEEISYIKGRGKVAFISYKSALRDRNGNIIGVIGTSLDITLLKTVQQELEDTSFMLKSIIDYAPGLIYWKDQNSTYLGANKYWCELAGIDKVEDVLGKKDKDLWPKKFADSLRKNDLVVLKTGKTLITEESAYMKSRETVVTTISYKSPFRDRKGNIIGIIGTALDITQLKAIQGELIEAKKKAEIASLSKTSFIATVSHELRTPLNAILGMTQILEGQELTKSQQECVEAIHSSGKNLLTLINDILDYAKLEAGKVELKPGPLDIAKAIREACETASHLTSEKNIKLQTNFAKKIPNKVIGDELRIRQVLLNFLSNAVKFTEKGKISITVGCSTREDIATFRIIVEDTGIGIPQEAIPTLFERFTQVESAYSRRFHGTGLGLAIVKNLVETMGGEVGVTSKLGKGSRFWFTIPLPIDKTKKNIEKTNEPVPNKIQLTFSRPYSTRILVVEDNKLNQRVLQMMLQDFNCQIDIANNGEEAIRLFKKNKYHLIFMDIGLPDMDGMKLTRKLRELEKNKNSVTPILALTAHVLEEDRVACLNAGASDVLLKPIMREHLVTALNQYCP